MLIAPHDKIRRPPTPLLTTPKPFTLITQLRRKDTMNRMLTSEFVRKTQLEADQVAARQIQQTLTSAKVDEVPGYEVEAFYKPLRDVGGDYFDVIELGDNRTLVAIADVSGKGMPAALLAANIQALVRSNAGMSADPLVLTRQINRHLSRYTPVDRFATAVFLVLDREAGTLIYVNAGHNAPIVFSAGKVRMLDATGMPLGLFPEASYTADTAFLSPGGRLLLFFFSPTGFPTRFPGKMPKPACATLLLMLPGIRCKF
jgi:phosphoserine phosphatase RsbU/P